MQIDGCEFLVDAATKFHRALHVWGWFHHPQERLTSVSIRHPDIKLADCEVGLPHGGVESTLGPKKGFRIDALLSKSVFPDDAEVTFGTESGREICTTLAELRKERIARMRSLGLFRDFRKTVQNSSGAKLLDIGGRDRSRQSISGIFSPVEVTVLDIVSGPDVDVVGDAHKLSKLFEPAQFDFVHSASVFEHLIMPWLVVLEMNSVMKMGATAFISTHQTLGIHDAPWDFYRFSDTAWDGLFNSETGFEILERRGDFESFIIPSLFREGKENAEGSMGHEASSVLVQKTGNTRLTWDVDVDSILTTVYPTEPDTD
jgi:hypothetical protein